MPIKPRKILKDYFSSGKLPSATNFADLIDSFVHQTEDITSLGISGTTLSKEIAAGTTPPAATNQTALNPVTESYPPGNLAAAQVIVPAPSDAATTNRAIHQYIQIPANKKWGSVITGVATICCFDIYAAASNGNKHAITQASLLFLPNNKKNTIKKKTISSGGFCNAIKFKWVFTPPFYQLQMKTTLDYGCDIYLKIHIKEYRFE